MAENGSVGKKNGMTTHAEIPVKVNAWVDEGIAPLVEALNEFERVWTAASCENDASPSLTPYAAYVMFSYQGSGAEATLFGAKLVEALGESIPFCLETDWRAENDGPVLTISCPPDQVSDLAAALRKVAEPSDGKARTELRS